MKGMAILGLAFLTLLLFLALASLAQVVPEVRRGALDKSYVWNEIVKIVIVLAAQAYIVVTRFVFSY